MEKLFIFLEEEYRLTSIVDVEEKHLNHFIRNFGKSVTKREDSFSAKSVNRYISTLRTFFKFLLKENIIEVNPA